MMDRQQPTMIVHAKEETALDRLIDAYRLLVSPGVNMALYHATKHSEDIGLDADDYYNVEAGKNFAEIDEAEIQALISRFERA